MNRTDTRPQVDKYNRLLDDVSQALGGIHAAYTSPDAPRQINISHYLTKKVSADIKQSTQFTLPTLENIFVGAQEHVEKLLASDIYPRFVKHQITASATAALSAHRYVSGEHFSSYSGMSQEELLLVPLETLSAFIFSLYICSQHMSWKQQLQSPPRRSNC
jgi:Regulator of G protein signaling domain